jgi:hypothetical protein
MMRSFRLSLALTRHEGTHMRLVCIFRMLLPLRMRSSSFLLPNFGFVRPLPCFPSSNAYPLSSSVGWRSCTGFISVPWFFVLITSRSINETLQHGRSRLYDWTEYPVENTVRATKDHALFG